MANAEYCQIDKERLKDINYMLTWENLSKEFVVDLVALSLK